VNTADNRQGLKGIAETIFNSGLRAVDPEACVKRCLQLAAGDLRVGETACRLGKISKLYLVGAGKASAAMARSAEELLGDRIDEGLIITKYGHGVPLRRCRVMEAGHPVPDENGVEATRALLDLVATAGPDDLVL
jgi:glycerate-2-kinase